MKKRVGTKQEQEINVRELREKLGLFQREFAALVGAHPISVCKWERGQVKPDWNHAQILRQLLSFKTAGKKKELRDIILRRGGDYARTWLARELGRG